MQVTESAMVRMTFRLRPETLDQLKAIEAKRARTDKRHPSERVRLVVEDYVERQGRKPSAK